MDADANDDKEMQREEEKCEIETAKSKVSSEREEMKPQVNWSDLPPIPLEKIFYFLNHFDRVNMSLVCRNWSEGYGSPSVWKTFRFALTESMISEENSPVMKFVRKYNKMFRHVDIEYRLMIQASEELINTWCKLFREFLQILAENSQLISWKIYDFYLFFMSVDTSTRADVIGDIATFLKSQHLLKDIQLNYFSNIYQDYESILKHVNENSRNSIRYIGLRGLKICEEHDSPVENCLLTILKFPNLKDLSIDYSRVLEITFACQSLVMEALKKCEKRANLLNMILTYNKTRNLDEIKGLTSADWLLLRKLFPNMRVYLNFVSYRRPRREVPLVIVPDMPIVYLHFTFHYNDSTRRKIEALFACLFQRMGTDHLEILLINWAFPIPDFTSIFFPFIHALKKLKYLGVFITPNSTNIKVLIKSWLKTRPGSLKDVYINIYDVENDHDYKILEKLRMKYVDRLTLEDFYLKVNVHRKK